jgi:spore coat protein U-like protein
MIMKKRQDIALLCLAFATTLCAGEVSAATATSNVSASIVTAISITKTADMDFADVVASGSAGTVVLSTAGARSITGGATLGNSTGAAAAAFTVSGDPASTYSISLPSSATITSTPNTMTVNTFTSSPSGTGTLSGGGTQALTVGATLQVGASQAQGTYTGTFDVTVAYN